MKSLKVLMLLLAGGAPVGAFTFWADHEHGAAGSAAVAAVESGDDRPNLPGREGGPEREGGFGGEGGFGRDRRFGPGRGFGPGREEGGEFGRGPRALARRNLQDYLRLQSMSKEEFQRFQEVSRQREAEEWARMLAFAREYAPNRYQLLTKLDPPPGAPVRNRILMRWLVLEQSRRNFPDLFNLHVEQFKEEDAVLGLAAELKQAEEHNDAAAVASARQKIQDQANRLVCLNFRERALRITAAQAALSEEQTRLDKDVANIAELVTERAEQILKKANASLEAPRRSELKGSAPAAPRSDVAPRSDAGPRAAHGAGGRDASVECEDLGAAIDALL